MSFEVAPIYVLVLEGGVGLGLEGLQSALTGRLRLPLRSMALGVGAGLSAGPYRIGNADDCTPFFGPCSQDGSSHEWVWNRAVWRNIEVSVERRSVFGLYWRLYGGSAAILNPAAAECVLVATPVQGGVTCPELEHFSTAYLGTSLGYAFK